MDTTKKVNDDFFTEVSNNKPYFKAAFEGFAGSGKTFTAAQLVIGLHKKIKSTKPIVMVDTEKASKFLKPLFDEANIKLLVKESKSLTDLREAMKKCREGYSDIIIIDSLTHIYENFLEAYKVKTGHQRLQFQDWGIIKPTWKTEFSDPLVNDPYNLVFCGRAGYEYSNEIDAETGKREIYKSGVKMKVEGETAYEPDMLVLMERFEEMLGKEKKVWREATIVKDRSNLIDGKTFVNPTYSDFAPVIDAMLANASNEPTKPMGDDTQIIKTEEDKRAYLKKKDIILEKIGNEMTKYAPGQSAEVKQKRIELSEKVFLTNSWTEIETYSLKSLEDGYGKLIRVIALEKKANDETVKGKDVKIKK